jgi:uncharacterized iron-regulated membrane protein
MNKAGKVTLSFAALALAGVMGAKINAYLSSPPPAKEPSAEVPVQPVPKQATVLDAAQHDACKTAQPYEQALAAEKDEGMIVGTKILHAITPLCNYLQDRGFSDIMAVAGITDPGSDKDQKETRLHAALRQMKASGNGQVFGVGLNADEVNQFEYGVALRKDGSLSVVARELQQDKTYLTIHAAEVDKAGKITVSPDPASTSLSEFGLKDPAQGHLPRDPLPLQEKPAVQPKVQPAPSSNTALA